MNNNSLKLCATIVSDTHMDIENPSLKLIMFNFRRSMQYAKKNNADAYITVGDTTSHGTRTNWNYARECFKKVGKCAKNIILTIGNHDCWHEDGYDAGIKEYYSAVKDITGRVLEKPYFSTYINGYDFICLGNESEAGCEANITDEQVEWFGNELDKATENGRPAFVFCHQSLNARHGLPRTWDRHEDPDADINDGGIGEKSEEIADIMKAHKNVFYFSGHSHMGLAGEKKQKGEGYASFYSENGVNLINLPSLNCGNHHGEKDNIGIGVQLEIYEDRVVLTPVNYFLGKPVKSVSIKDGKPYYEVKIK